MSDNDIYDLIIVGGGAGGLSAGIYAMRAALNTVLVEEKDVCGYAAATLTSRHARPAELRLQTSNAVKVWLNGRPVGVVACICPFNYPLNLVAHKVGPALAAGNSIIIKPMQTPVFPHPVFP